MAMIRLLTAVGLLVFGYPAQASVDGQCRYHGKDLHLVDGRAALAPDPFDDAGAKRPTLWFATAPFDHGKLNASPPAKLDDAITEQVFEHDSAELQLRLDAAGDAVEQIYLFVPPGSNLSHSGEALGTLRLSAPVGKRVAGRFLVEEEEWRCDLTFDLPMGATLPASGSTASAAGRASATATSATGQALPAGGGDPGKAYMALHRATRAGDADAMLAHLAADNAGKMRAARAQPDFAQTLAMVRAFEPATVRIVSGRVDGDHAKLQIEGTDSDGAAVTGDVSLVREAGGWKVDHVSTHSRQAD